MWVSILSSDCLPEAMLTLVSCLLSAWPGLAHIVSNFTKNIGWVKEASFLDPPSYPEFPKLTPREPPAFLPLPSHSFFTG